MISFSLYRVQRLSQVVLKVLELAPTGMISVTSWLPAGESGLRHAVLSEHCARLLDLNFDLDLVRHTDPPMSQAASTTGHDISTNPGTPALKLKLKQKSESGPHNPPDY